MLTTSIIVGSYIIFNLITQYIISDTEMYRKVSLNFKEDFPIKKLTTIVTIMRLLIIVSFIGLIYNIKESVIGIWIGYIILIIFSIISVLGMKNEINGVDISSMKTIQYILPLTYVIISIVITLLIKPIKDNFKKILPTPK